MSKFSKTLALFAATFIILTGCAKKDDFYETTTFVKLSGASDYTISKSGTYDLSGTLTGGKLKVEADGDVTIILSGVEITNESDEAVKIENAGITTIKTADRTHNTLSGGGDAAINAKTSIIFEGSGTLNVSGTQKHGIECDGDITIKSGTIQVNSYEHGIKSESVITILSGDIDITAKTGKGIKAEKEFLAEGGNVKINSIENEGLESKGALTINGGNFDIVAGEDGINAGTSDNTSTDATTDGGKSTGAVPPEGAQPENFRPEGRFPEGGEGEPTNPDADASQNTERPIRNEMPPPDFQIPDDEIPVPPSDFEIPEGMTTSGRGIPFEHERGKGGKGAGFGTGGMGRINADSVLTINGGTIKINCLGDGIDSNGTLSINGGTVIIDGPENSGNGPLDSDGEMLINGATVLTASSRGMTQIPRSMSQGILNFTFDTALLQGDEIVIMNSDKKIISEHTVGRICEMLLFTSPDIAFDEEYTVYVNGIEHSATNASGSMQGDFGGMGGGFAGPGRGNR